MYYSLWWYLLLKNRNLEFSTKLVSKSCIWFSVSFNTIERPKMGLKTDTKRYIISMQTFLNKWKIAIGHEFQNFTNILSSYIFYIFCTHISSRFLKFNVRIAKLLFTFKVMSTNWETSSEMNAMLCWQLFMKDLNLEFSTAFSSGSCFNDACTIEKVDNVLEFCLQYYKDFVKYSVWKTP